MATIGNNQLINQAYKERQQEAGLFGISRDQNRKVHIYFLNLNKSYITKAEHLKNLQKNKQTGYVHWQNKIQPKPYVGLLKKHKNCLTSICQYQPDMYKKICSELAFCESLRNIVGFIENMVFSPSRRPIDNRPFPPSPSSPSIQINWLGVHVWQQLLLDILMED